MQMQGLSIEPPVRSNRVLEQAQLTLNFSDAGRSVPE
jgi:hypothetical protein